MRRIVYLLTRSSGLRYYVIEDPVCNLNQNKITFKSEIIVKYLANTIHLSK